MFTMVLSIYKSQHYLYIFIASGRLYPQTLTGVLPLDSLLLPVKKCPSYATAVSLHTILSAQLTHYLLDHWAIDNQIQVGDTVTAAVNVGHTQKHKSSWSTWI